MHGVPADLPLAPFVGHDLNQIALGRFQLQLHFAGVGHIAIEGRWEVHDPKGARIDRDQEHADRETYKIHRIIDLPVTRFEIDAPRSFTLVFEPGYRLTIFDDSEQYELFSVHIAGMPSIYV